MVLSADISVHTKALIHAGGDLYEVGGPVRDRLLGLPVKDHDLLCRHLSVERICAILKPLGRVAAVGKSFGVVKFSPHREPELEIDIALPRRELSTGQGHRDFDVAFDPELPVEDDLGRRDFTINAMALSLSDGRIIDPFSGKRDLEERLLRQVFPKAFEEDPLRLVRAVQFAARFGLAIEPGTLEAMARCAPLIGTVSGERIVLELAKLMSAPRPSKGFNLMLESGLMKHILPEIAALRGIEQDKQPGDDVYGHTMRVVDACASDREVEHRGDLELLFAALLHDIGKAGTAKYHPPSKRVVFFGHQLVSVRLARRWMQRMKLTTAGLDPSRILRLIEFHMFETKATFTDRAIRRFVAKVGQDLIFQLLDLRLADNRGGKHPHGTKGVTRLRARIREELAKKPPFGPKDLAADGSDLMAIGIPEGPAVGFVLVGLVEKVLDEPELNTKDELLALAREMMKNLPAELMAVRKRKAEKPDASKKSKAGQGSKA
ncbi:MAG: HD domain-containing protein [Pseudomonadota bacterium]